MPEALTRKRRPTFSKSCARLAETEHRWNSLLSAKPIHAKIEK